VAAYIWVQFTGGFGTQSLFDHGGLVGEYVMHGEWWRIVTGAFLHGGLMHIAFNMFALYQVGQFVELVIGRTRMLAIYTIAMIGSGIAVTYFQPNSVTVGASGAIFGLFGALVAIGIRLGPPGRDLIKQTLPIIGINLAIGFSLPNISNAGHIGGLLCGFVAGLILFAMQRTAGVAVDQEHADQLVHAGGHDDAEPHVTQYEATEHAPGEYIVEHAHAQDESHEHDGADAHAHAPYQPEAGEERTP
jgi:membrane associated rhomboid family serine protease